MNLTNNFIIDVRMSPLNVVLQVCGIYIFHLKSTLLALTASPLLPASVSEGVASKLLVYGCRV